jgi:hypothetical protein
MGGYTKPEMPRPPEQALPQQNPEAEPKGPEAQEVSSRAPSDPIVVPAVPAAQQLPAVTAFAPSQTPASDDSPLIANDEDLIEKEWVTKAKKIVEQTRSDPYRQESEVSKLQADYLKKRYGKDIKVTGK